MIFLVFSLYLVFIIYITIGFFRLPKETSMLSDKKEVTVVMAVKNEAKNIKKTLNEFFNQTYRNVKFIIVDDNSCDETASFIKSSELFSTGKLRLLSAIGMGKKQAIEQAQSFEYEAVVKDSSILKQQSLEDYILSKLKPYYNQDIEFLKYKFKHKSNEVINRLIQ